jgi:hypothetical protein
MQTGKRQKSSMQRGALVPFKVVVAVVAATKPETVVAVAVALVHMVLAGLETAARDATGETERRYSSQLEAAT